MRTSYQPTESQARLASIGRSMMNFSENYGNHHSLRGISDAGLNTLNELSSVGNMLTRYGAVYGTKLTDFSEKDLQLIELFLAQKVVIK
jgi:hypothetical protein